MSTVTAFAMIGTPHPNDGGISPTHLAELWEGSVATWVLRRLSDGNVLSRTVPSAPEQVGDTLRGLIEQFAPNAESVAPWNLTVLVGALDGSTLLTQLASITALDQCELHVMKTQSSRTFNVWSKTWQCQGVWPEGSD